jgi:ankyrin repeat protein
VTTALQVLETLLKAGADVFRKDADDWSALHFAGAPVADSCVQPHQTGC